MLRLVRHLRPAQTILLLVFVLGWAALAHAEATLVGPATAVEGDVIEIGGRHIRLFGIRAPALTEQSRAGGEAWPCGQAALSWLQAYLEDREVACRERGRDDYGRMVALCYVGGENLSATLVRAGWALNNPADGMNYAGAEEEAQNAGNGLWRGSGHDPRPGAGTVLRLGLGPLSHRLPSHNVLSVSGS